jgi:sulfite exporter TauE/SafE
MGQLDLFSMFLLGVLGTGHCIGMCGPLVFAFPAQAGRISAHIFYHFGRVTTYVVVGVLMGSLGTGLAEVAASETSGSLVWVARIQVGFSVAAAVFLLLFSITRLGILPEPAWLSLASPNRIPGYKKILRSAVSGQSQAGMFFMGLMLGFLPCGLSFAAFARALPAGGPLQGGLLVLAFALGTVPGLLLVGTGAAGIARRYRRHSDILSGIVMAGMAFSLIADVAQALFS